MSRRARASAWLAAAAMVLLYGGCPDTDTSAPGASSAKAVTGASSSSLGGGGNAASGQSASTAASASSGGGCAPEPIPEGVPPGWVEYTDWSCDCRFYLPGSKTVMSAAIAWQKCPLSPGGIDCQSMVIDWTKDNVAVDLDAAMASGVSGAVLGFQRRGLDNSKPYLLKVIAEPDGAVRAALLKMWVPGQFESKPGCIVIQEALRDDKFIYTVLGHDANGNWHTSHHKGALGGSIDDLHPKVLADYDDPYEDGWACSSTRVFRYTAPLTLKAYDWDMKNETFIAAQAKDPEGLQFGQPLAAGDDFFWTSDNLYAAGINSWSSADGAKPFIRYVGDATRGAGNLGTDGATLVWSYGEGKKPNEMGWPVRSIMMSPYTTDPAKLSPKRLRSDPSAAITGEPFRVACGRAAHGRSLYPMVVVRLNDGLSWLLPPKTKGEFEPLTVLGLTCDHVYVLGWFGGRVNIARIRLDSLGPGIFPD